MVCFGLRHTGDCINKTSKTVYDNIDSFPDGLYSYARMQLHAWVLWVPFTKRNHQWGGKSQNNESHPCLQERPHHPDDIMQTMESQTLSLPIYTKKDVDLPEPRRQEWYPAVHKHQLIWQNHCITESPNSQKGS